MATAFDAKERDRLLAEAEKASQFYKDNWKQSSPTSSMSGGAGMNYAAFGLGRQAEDKWRTTNQAALDSYNKANKLRQQAAAVDPDSAAGKSEAAWQEAMALLQKQGPYTPAVVNQLTNRRADQTAAAEAVNAEEIRNQAAARGMDPTQAIRGLQQGRQAQNVAFSGDIASQAAVQNFAAETPGRMAAAQANLGRQFGGATQNAVYGGGVQTNTAPRTAFASQSFNPGTVHQQAATMNQTSQPINLNRPVTATAAANAAPRKPIDMTEKQYMTPFNQRPNQNVIEQTPTQQKSTLNSLNSLGVKVYTPGAFGTPKQYLQNFGVN